MIDDRWSPSFEVGAYLGECRCRPSATGSHERVTVHESEPGENADESDTGRGREHFAEQYPATEAVTTGMAYDSRFVRVGPTPSNSAKIAACAPAPATTPR